MNATEASEVTTRRNQMLLVGSTAINTVGSGVYLPLSLLVLAGLSGLPLVTVGLILTVAQLLALVAMPFIGRAIDRTGARVVLIVAMALQAVGFALYPVLSGLVGFVVVTALIAVGNQTGKTARPALISTLRTGEARDRLLALNQSLANAGLGLGGLLLVVFSASSSGAYALICWFNAATFLAAALLSVLLRLDRPVPLAGRVSITTAVLSSLRDRAYAQFLGSSFFGALLYAALTTFIPLYVINVLRLPDAVAGSTFVVNTTIVALGGVPAVKLLHRTGASRVRGTALGLVLMAAGAAVLPVGRAVPHWAAAIIVLVAVVGYSVGEVVHAVTAVSLSLGMAPEHQRGQYQANYQAALTLGAAVAPALFTASISFVSFGGAVLAAGCGVCGVLLLRVGSGPGRVA